MVEPALLDLELWSMKGSAGIAVLRLLPRWVLLVSLWKMRGVW